MLDVEHFAKVKLLKRIEMEGEDGYAVVSDFISSYDGAKPDGTPCNSPKAEIFRGKNSPYTGGLIARYAICGIQRVAANLRRRIGWWFDSIAWAIISAQ